MTTIAELSTTVGELGANLSVVTRALEATVLQYSNLESDYGMVKGNMKHFFLCSMGAIICFMQCGFAFLECGAVRIRNATNILFKNAMDSFVGGLVYWMCGYALAFGNKGNCFLAYNNFFAIDLPLSEISFLFFQFSFAATATTIVSGAVAERMEMGAYLLVAALLTGFVYPVVSHWGWDSRGWLATQGFQDFAGSAIVHMCGGACAFVGAAILGPRYMRFSKGMDDVFRGHSVPHVALGAFIIFFGFLAFNGASVGDITAEGAGETLALAMLVTVLAGATCALLTLIFHRRYSVNLAVNGAIAGMVAACGGCNVYYTYTGVVCGAVAALMFNAVSWINKKIRVDDPLDAVAVHFGGGFVGILLVPIFDKNKGLIYGSDKRLAAKIMAWNMIGTGAIVAWAAGFCIIIFGLLRILKVLRVERHYETHGMDEKKHNEPAYPDVLNIYNMVQPDHASPFGLDVKSTSEPDLSVDIPIATQPAWAESPKTNNWVNNNGLYKDYDPPKVSPTKRNRNFFRPKGRDRHQVVNDDPIDQLYVPPQPVDRQRGRNRPRLQSADYPNHQEYIPEFRDRPRRGRY